MIEIIENFVLIIGTLKASRMIIKRSKLPRSKRSHGPGDMTRINIKTDCPSVRTVDTATLTIKRVTTKKRANPSASKFMEFRRKKFINFNRNNPY
jgi:hypothetical protein